MIQLSKYKKSDKILAKTQKGEEIVGFEVDENNQTYYVIWRGNTLVAEKYNLHRIEHIIEPSRTITESVHQGSNLNIANPLNS